MSFLVRSSVVKVAVGLSCRASMGGSVAIAGSCRSFWMPTPGQEGIRCRPATDVDQPSSRWPNLCSRYAVFSSYLRLRKTLDPKQREETRSNYSSDLIHSTARDLNLPKLDRFYDLRSRIFSCLCNA